MRFVYFLLMILATGNLLIIILSGLTGINIYKRYGKHIFHGVLQFLLLLVVFLIAIAISGLKS